MIWLWLWFPMDPVASRYSARCPKFMMRPLMYSRIRCSRSASVIAFTFCSSSSRCLNAPITLVGFGVSIVLFPFSIVPLAKRSRFDIAFRSVLCVVGIVACRRRRLGRPSQHYDHHSVVRRSPPGLGPGRRRTYLFLSVLYLFGGHGCPPPGCLICPPLVS